MDSIMECLGPLLDLAQDEHEVIAMEQTIRLILQNASNYAGADLIATCSM